jgi:hypothetical protein
MSHYSKIGHIHTCNTLPKRKAYAESSCSHCVMLWNKSSVSFPHFICSVVLSHPLQKPFS